MDLEPAFLDEEKLVGSAGFCFSARQGAGNGLLFQEPCRPRFFMLFFSHEFSKNRFIFMGNGEAGAYLAGDHFAYPVLRRSALFCTWRLHGADV